MALFNTLFGARPANDRRARVSGSGTARRAAELLRSANALIQLSEDEALTVVSYMELRDCAEGEAIIRQGDSGGSGDDGFMALVVEGEVTVEALTVSRVDAQTVNVLGPGHLMGEMSLMDGAARSATCTASTDVRCAVLNRLALETMIAEEPATAAKLLSAVALRLSRRLREADSKLQLYSQLVFSMQQEIDRLVPDLD
ncbi:MAG: cyclic nucleotide-binding domain-containing protein [Hydrogenophaga sp.]|jgi:CRP/FNR family transcriptional regulator, cyclic AMP receptor protein|uniref:Crp/Fnr family transcriptional regulator n=1 Tax=Hydrogenophaga sp. TaxID=1904254 RepID=UPI00262D6446|nr:cyclic nucleotide-binding domain-containing protein [Hydrogenophaga sp.]MCW5670082.1 cyclic nucleotide-binding domain-containing protein [Hydrogenophaga sp.]